MTSTATPDTDLDQETAADVVDDRIPPASGQPTVLLDLPLEQLVANPNNPRLDVGDVSTLTDSIRSVGLLEPLVVVPAEVYRTAVAEPTIEMDDGTYVLVAGHRRRAAAALAGLTTVPCVVRDDLTGTQARMAMLLENLERTDLTVLEEAQAFAELVALDLTQAEIARRVGRTQSHISKRLDLLKLPDEGRQLVLDRTITLDQARALVPLAHKPKLIAWAVSRKDSHGGVEGAVKEQLKKDADDQAYTATVDELKTKNVRTVKFPPYGDFAHLSYSRNSYGYDSNLKKPARVSDLVNGKRVKSVAAHRKLDCHAVAVVTVQGAMCGGSGKKVGDTVDVCTSWADNHPLQEELDAEAAKAARAAALAEYRAELEARDAARHTHAAGLVTAKKPAKQLLDYVLRGVVEAATDPRYGDTNRRLALFLGIDIEDGETELTAQSKLLALADTSAADLLKVAAATQMLEDLAAGRPERDTQLGQLLKQTGYKPGPEPVHPDDRNAAQQDRPPAKYSIDDRVMLDDDPGALGKVTAVHWSEDQEAYLYDVFMYGGGNGNEGNVPEHCVAAAPLDGEPGSPEGGVDEPLAHACADCGCTTDGPCDQEGHCADAEGYGTCSLVEGDVRCSNCEPATPGVEDVTVAGGEL